MSGDAVKGTGTLLPAAGALVSRDNDGEKPLFAMFTDEWLQLQQYIASIQQLPITQGDFTSKYGTFNDASEVTGLVTAMQSIRALSGTFGDPNTLFEQLSNDPNLLNTKEPPDRLYDNIVWTAFKVAHAADTFHGTLGSFLELLSPANCGTPAECGQVLKEVLIGPGGLQSTAVDAAAKVNQLIAKLSGFDVAIAPLNDTLQRYTSRSSKILNDAINDVNVDAAKIVDLVASADAALKKWRDLTISATSVSVGLVIITGGIALPVSAIAGGVLGAEAVKARDQYNQFCALRNVASIDKAQKQQLVADLTGLDSLVGSAGRSSAAFIASLQKVSGAWLAISNDLANIVQNYTPEELGDYSRVNQALACEAATKEWQAIGEAARAYTRNSLVPLTFQEAGKPLPTS